ncbi:hypothetical protein HPT29_018540 [Microvirga terrae]|uniref:DNA-directed DNA polymerase family A palm domain-containing protein n=1 Tax=Microvirga terrae TaxID=2740529 RepID=A0ABY5RQ71_9HYPH|nr:hypothetical protein [Microvirga terrae]UVF18471.1 hypothetical protein HPT29_018540 [Microvirga terrae]
MTQAFDTAEPPLDQYMQDPDPEVPFTGTGVGTVASAASRPALVPDLGLPDCPSTATNRDEPAGEEIGLTDLRDRPLTYHWRADEQLLPAAGALPTGDANYNALMNGVATELVRAADIEPRVWVSISRNETKYTCLKGKVPRWVTYSRMMVVLADLVGRGLIEEDRANAETSHFEEWTTPQGKKMRGRQSRYRATPALLAAFRSVTRFHHEAGDNVLRMKDADGKAVNAFRETDYVRRLAEPARRYNQLMCRHDVELMTQDADCNRTRIEIPHQGKDGRTHLQVLCPTPTVTIFRSFSRGRWTKGGRFYWWGQGLPKTLRAQLRIDGQAVIELDYRALHPSMLYTLRGLAIPADCYTVPGVPVRDDAKSALVVMISSSSRQEAVEALLAKADDNKYPWRHDRKATWAILKAMERAYAPILADLYQDKGIDLMYLDGQMTAWVLAQCAKRDLPILPVHDSYLCRVADEAEVRALMATAWSRHFDGACPVITPEQAPANIETFDKKSDASSTSSRENPFQTLPPSSFSRLPLSLLLPVSPAAVKEETSHTCSQAKLLEAPGPVVETSTVEDRGLSQVSPKGASQGRLRGLPACPIKPVSSAPASKAEALDDDIPLDPDFVYVPEPPEPKGTPSPELQLILDRQRAFCAAGLTSVRPTYRKRTKEERERWLWAKKS